MLGQVEEPFIRWPWVTDHLEELRDATLQHLQLAGAALGIGFGVSLALAVVIRRWRWTGPPILGLTTLLYAVPSVALFAALIPWLGIGIATPIVALSTYSLVVLTPYLVDSFDAVPPDVVDAAVGLGFTGPGRFWRVEVPLAVPTVVGGLRIAAVTIIGLVTVAGLFGLGGFGNLIDDGLSRDFSTPIVLGVVGSVLLAVIADVVLVIAGRLVSPWSRR